MHWFAGMGPVVSLALNHRLVASMPPASDSTSLFSGLWGVERPLLGLFAGWNDIESDIVARNCSVAEVSNQNVVGAFVVRGC